MARMQPIVPEVIEPDEKLPPDLVALRNFARLMDEAVAIPGTRKRIAISDSACSERARATRLCMRMSSP